MPVMPSIHRPKGMETSYAREGRNRHQLGYTNAWARRSKDHLMRHPLCVRCQSLGKVKAATCCDHVVPHHGDLIGVMEGEIQSLCDSCHSGWKRNVERAQRRAANAGVHRAALGRRARAKQG